MKDKIVVVGSCNVDMIMKVDHIPSQGETVSGGEYTQVFGGKGANQAVSAARSGGKVAFVSSVGDDIFTPPMLKNFKEDGINTKYIFKESGVNCGTALVMIGEKGNNLITVAPGANDKLSPEHLDTASRIIKSAEILILQNEIPIETVEYAIDIAKKYELKIIWNFAPARVTNIDIVKRCDYLILNEIEAEFMTKMKIKTQSEAKKAAKSLFEKGVENVIITLGSKGSSVYSNEFKGIIPAHKVEAVDSTAAGDIFCGSLAVALTEKKGIEEAVNFATVASAISVTKLGAQPSAPTRKEILFFQENLKN